MKNNGSAIFLPLSILIFCPQALAQGGALVGPSYSGTDGLIEVTAFGAHDQSQCENVDQTGGERPEACPSIEEAQSLSFMAFGDQDMPLQGYGIGDSVINEDGICANLDAKYSTYYNGLTFWDHAWITQEDAQRLEIQVGSQLVLQEGQCPEIRVTAFGAHDQSQCENVDQTGGERPEACPSIEEAQSLSFMAFGDQDMPLQGYGIGDSVINEDGVCANLDAKYSTYYDGLTFWDHAWITQEDAQRLEIQVGSRLIAQEGLCEVPEEPGLLHSLSALNRTGERLIIRMWPYEGLVARLCVENEDGSERCKEKELYIPKKYSEHKGGGLSIQLNDQVTGFNLIVINEAGESSNYGSYNIPPRDSWDDVFACESEIRLENVEARYRADWGELGRWILRYDLASDARIRTYGLNRHGKSKRKNPVKLAGQRRHYGFGQYEGQDEIDLILRDRQGCIAEQTFTMPSANSWSVAEEK